MTEPIIKTQNLTFHFPGKKNAVKELNLNVPQGSIYGFLGPNGAGKSTTIRMLSGLLHPSSGEIEVFGQNIRKSKTAILRRSASMIEEPTAYNHLSGWQNLHLLCKASGYSPDRIDEVLEAVNLSDDKHRKVRTYSMGMKQRLGIAASILPDPDLFILDEPTNGLDPQGMYEIRELIVSLNRDYGKTVFISSHLLGEIEKMCTHVGIIHHGKSLFEGTIDELSGLSKSRRTLKIETTSSKEAIEKANGKWETSIIDQENFLIFPKEKEDQAEIIRFLTNSEIKIFQAQEMKNNLEELFIEVTENKNNEK